MNNTIGKASKVEAVTLFIPPAVSSRKTSWCELNGVSDAEITNLQGLFAFMRNSSNKKEIEKLKKQFSNYTPLEVTVAQLRQASAPKLSFFSNCFCLSRAQSRFRSYMRFDFFNMPPVFIALRDDAAISLLSSGDDLYNMEWVEVNSTTVLPIPPNSFLLKEIERTKEIKKKKSIPLSNLEVGGEYVLSNGHKEIYLGLFYNLKANPQDVIDFNSGKIGKLKVSKVFYHGWATCSDTTKSYFWSYTRPIAKSVMVKELVKKYALPPYCNPSVESINNMKYRFWNGDVSLGALEGAPLPKYLNDVLEFV